MLMYIDPGTGGAIFSSLPVILAALGGGVAVFFGLLLRPVRQAIAGIFRALLGTKQDRAVKAEQSADTH